MKMKKESEEKLIDSKNMEEMDLSEGYEQILTNMATSVGYSVEQIAEKECFKSSSDNAIVE